MGNVPPGETFEGGGDTFMSAAVRAEVCQSGAPLYIVAAKPKGKNKFGDFTGFTVVIGGTGERRKERFLLALSHNEIRERQATEMVQALALPDVTSVGPVYLGQVETKAGQTAWVLQNSPHEGEVIEQAGEGDVAPAAAAASTAAPGDDDIPF